MKAMKTIGALFAMVFLAAFVAGTSLASFDADLISAGAASPHIVLGATASPDVTRSFKIAQNCTPTAERDAFCKGHCQRYMATSNKECSDNVDRNEAMFIKNGTYEQERANCRRHRDSGYQNCYGNCRVSGC